VCEPGEEDQRLPSGRVKIRAPEARIQAEEMDLSVDLKTEEEIEVRALPIRAIITKEQSLVAELPEET
jgi:hypothetical protein